MRFKLWFENEAEEHFKRKLAANKKSTASRQSDHLGRPKGATVGGNPRYSGKGWSREFPNRSSEKEAENDQI